MPDLTIKAAICPEEVMADSHFWCSIVRTFPCFLNLFYYFSMEFDIYILEEEGRKVYVCVAE